MKVIHKYHVPVMDAPTQIQLPLLAEVLCVQTQGGEPHIWVLGDTELEKELRSFRWHGTGHYGVSGKYVGTIQQVPYVWHLFEVV